MDDWRIACCFGIKDQESSPRLFIFSRLYCTLFYLNHLLKCATMSAGIAKTAKPSTHVDPKSAPLKEIPDVLVDPRTMKRYMRGRFLGKGGFAKCYEITEMETKEVFAGKVVPKSMLLKPHQKEKMSSEIAIHKSLDNPHVVGFHGFFEDDDFVYVVLEICRRRVRTGKPI